MTRKKWFVAVFCVLSLAQPASAQNWPTKPIRFITAFAPGSASDVLARIVADRLTVALGQQVIIDGRAGGNGVIAATIAAKSAPDGYTYLLVLDNHATNPSLQKKLPYDTLKDFSPLTLLADSPYGLVVGLATPYRTLKDLIAVAKSQPGKLTAGSSGAGSRGQLAIALLGQRGGFEITQISYRGPAQAMTDLLGGQITMRMSVVFFIMPFVKTERVRILGVTTAARLAQLPAVPTIAEQGFPGYEVYSWWGIVAPAGVPKPIFQKMHAELIRALDHPETRDRVAQLGATVHPTTPEEFDRYIRSEMNLWGKIVRDYKFSQTE